MVCIMSFDTEEEAVILANGTEVGLAGAIWTTDVRAFSRLTRTSRLTHTHRLTHTTKAKRSPTSHRV